MKTIIPTAAEIRLHQMMGLLSKTQAKPCLDHTPGYEPTCSACSQDLIARFFQDFPRVMEELYELRGLAVLVQETDELMHVYTEAYEKMEDFDPKVELIGLQANDMLDILHATLETLMNPPDRGPCSMADFTRKCLAPHQ